MVDDNASCRACVERSVTYCHSSGRAPVSERNGVNFHPTSLVDVSQKMSATADAPLPQFHLNHSFPLYPPAPSIGDNVSACGISTNSAIQYQVPSPCRSHSSQSVSPAPSWDPAETRQSWGGYEWCSQEGTYAPEFPAAAYKSFCTFSTDRVSQHLSNSIFHTTTLHSNAKQQLTTSPPSSSYSSTQSPSSRA